MFAISRKHWYDGGMNTSVIDTLGLADEFADAGFDKSKARILAAKFGELANERFVTKEDLRNELEKLELRLTIKMAIVMTAVIGLFKVMDKFF